MCMGLATTARAGGLEVTTYPERVAKLQEVAPTGGTVYVAPAEEFGWPESDTLTIPANVKISVSTPWEIPQGITVNFETNSK